MGLSGLGFPDPGPVSPKSTQSSPATFLRRPRTTFDICPHIDMKADMLEEEKWQNCSVKHVPL